MLKKSNRKILVGVISSALFSVSSVSLVLAEDNQTHNLMSGSGEPVLSNQEGNCVKTPVSPNDPNRPFEVCGDVRDSDGDGVFDDKDECPNTPKDAKVDERGCPDSDNDGVADDKDDCPNNTPEEISAGVDSRGCPRDSDGDGVPDYRDRCPNTPRGQVVRADGCAESDVRSVDVSTLSADVSFAVNKSDLRSEARQILDEKAAQIIQLNDVIFDVIVVGHTDSTGSNKYNQSLSERRAASVMNYLISKGVSASVIKAHGEGEDRPIASNNTKDGRAKNRRVEISVRKIQ